LGAVRSSRAQLLVAGSWEQETMARLILALLASTAVGASGSALVDGTTTLTQANIDGFVADAIAAGKTAMVRFIASEG